MTIGLHQVAKPSTLVITGTPITVTQINVPYTGFSVIGDGGTPPYIYSLTSGTFPLGLTINSSSGLVSGTPLAVILSSSLTLQVTDKYGRTAQLASFSINVTL
jgi:hypothetical protein